MERQATAQGLKKQRKEIYHSLKKMVEEFTEKTFLMPDKDQMT